jgi:hypothetical protein
MKNRALFKYRKARRERVLQKCAGMRAAKERKRIERSAECGEWAPVCTLLVMVNAAPDGRTMGIRTSLGEWEKVGTHRACIAALARMIEGKRARRGKA